ncbi:MAG TPA: alpha/beta hydrolase [Anaeromyxobacteraceae bacterium]|nr:alpha/beta hydrolase [Anaeromyxobacteraceae bacterium]
MRNLLPLGREPTGSLSDLETAAVQGSCATRYRSQSTSPARRSTWTSASDHLPSVRVPTLVVAGEKDTWTPFPNSVRMPEEIEGSDLLVLPAGTHTGPLEHPELVVAVREVPGPARGRRDGWRGSREPAPDRSRETSGSWFSTFATRDWFEPISLRDVLLREAAPLSERANGVAQRELRLLERGFHLGLATERSSMARQRWCSARRSRSGGCGRRSRQPGASFHDRTCRRG